MASWSLSSLYPCASGLVNRAETSYHKLPLLVVTGLARSARTADARLASARVGSLVHLHGLVRTARRLRRGWSVAGADQPSPCRCLPSRVSLHAVAVSVIVVYGEVDGVIRALQRIRRNDWDCKDSADARRQGLPPFPLHSTLPSMCLL